MTPIRNRLSLIHIFAPFSHTIIVIGDHLEEAKNLAKNLESEGKTVLIDDRTTGFGQKAGDADLFGIPNRIILSDKTLEKGGYELKKRTESEGIIEMCIRDSCEVALTAMVWPFSRCSVTSASMSPAIGVSARAETSSRSRAFSAIRPS